MSNGVDVPDEIYVLMAANYPWATTDKVNDLTYEELKIYLDGIKLLEFRRHYPIALLTSILLNNLTGGKAPSKNSKKIPKHFQYNPEDFLPDYANPFTFQLSPRAARDILDHVTEPYFPLFAVSLLPSEEDLKRTASK